MSETTVEWTAEGDGWVGRWRAAGGDYGANGDLVAEPEGGLHGGWLWSLVYGSTEASGTAADYDEAMALCAAVFFALESVHEDRS